MRGYMSNTDGFSMYRDLDGKPVVKTSETHPYCYDTFVVWQNNHKRGVGELVHSDRIIVLKTMQHSRISRHLWGNEGHSFYNRKPEEIEIYLTHLLGKRLRLTAITQSCNVAHGYPYWGFHFVYVD